jgi:Putative addiction module component
MLRLVGYDWVSVGSGSLEDAVTPTVQHLATEALRLDEDARAQLAAILLESLDEDVEAADSDSRWLAEADRRDRELASGAVEGCPWEDVLAAARARLR